MDEKKISLSSKMLNEPDGVSWLHSYYKSIQLTNLYVGSGILYRSRSHWCNAKKWIIVNKFIADYSATLPCR